MKIQSPDLYLPILKRFTSSLDALTGAMDFSEGLERSLRIFTEILQSDYTVLARVTAIEEKKVRINAMLTVAGDQGKWEQFPVHVRHILDEDHTKTGWLNALCSGNGHAGEAAGLSPVLAELADPEGIQTFLLFPVITDQKIWGLLGISRQDPISWGDLEKCALQTYAGTLGNDLIRRTMEETLRQERDYFSRIIDLSPNLIFAKDRAGRYTLANQSMAQEFGLHSPQELIGKKDMDFFPEETIERPYVQDDQKVLQTGETLVLPLEEVVDRLGRKRFFQTFKTAIPGKDGKSTEVLGVSVDITEQKLAERRILEEQHLIQTILATNPDVILVIDIDTLEVQYLHIENDVIGFHAKEMTNPFEFLFEHLHPEDLPKINPGLFNRLRAAKDDEIVEVEYRVQGTDKQWHTFHQRSKAFKRYPDGRLKEYFALIQNVTEQRKAQKGILESERRYRNFFTYGADGIYFVNCNEPIAIDLPIEEQIRHYYDHASIEEANQSMARMYGLENSLQLVGRPAREIPGSLGFGENACSMAQFIQNNYRLKDLETAEKDAGGRTRYFLNQAIGIIQDGHLTGIWGTLQDITPRREVENALRESEALFRSLYEDNPLGIALSDRKGTIVKVNEAFCEMLGFQAEELLGKTFGDLSHPDEREEENDLLEKALRNQESSFFMERRFLDREGKTIWVNLSTSFVYDDDNRLRFVLSMVDDISEQRLVRQALEESEVLQKAILSALPDLKFRINRSGHVVGYYPSGGDAEDPSPNSFLGKHLTEIMPLHIAQGIFHNLKLAISTEEVHSFEYAMTGGNTLQYYEARLSAVNDQEAIAVIRNVSERRKAQEALQEKIRELDVKNRQLKKYIDSNMQLENFAYIASHDLREPLRTMRTFAQLLQKRYDGQLDESANTYLGFITSAAQNMNQLIEDLLAYSRVDTGEHPREKLQLPALIHEVIDSLGNMITETRAHISLDMIPETINGNATQIKQVIQNLIVNALKFRRQGVMPRINISSTDLGSFWQFAFTDNGIGVDPQFHEQIFLIFKKLHNRQEYQGTGIGLALCKKIVEQHGGQIWLESRSGQGATFYFTLKK